MNSFINWIKSTKKIELVGNKRAIVNLDLIELENENKNIYNLIKNAPDSFIASVRDELALDGTVETLFNIVYGPEFDSGCFPLPASDSYKKLCVCTGLVVSKSKPMIEVVTVSISCDSCGSITTRNIREDDNSGIFSHANRCRNCKSRSVKILEKFNVTHTFATYQVRNGNINSSFDNKMFELHDICVKFGTGTYISTKDKLGDIAIGERVKIVGILRVQKKSNNDDGRMNSEPIIDAITVTRALNGRQHLINRLENEYHKTGTGFSFIRNYLDNKLSVSKWQGALVRNYCASIYGLDIVKICMMCVAVSQGSAIGNINSMHDRKSIHALIVGKPSTGKYSIVSELEKIIFNGDVLYINSKTATTAGLFGSKHVDDTTISGALTNARDGLCVLLDIVKIKDDIAGGICQAMETQEVKIVKADVNAKLITNCNIVGIATDRGSDPCTFLSDMPLSLLSRFDLVFYLDSPQKEATDLILENMLGLDSLDQPIATSNFMSGEEFLLAMNMARNMYKNIETIPPVILEIIDRYCYYLSVMSEKDRSARIWQGYSERYRSGLVRLISAFGCLMLHKEPTVQDALSIITICDFITSPISAGAQYTHASMVKRMKGILNLNNI